MDDFKNKIPKGLTVTITHPEIPGGKETYKPEDGWEIFVALGKREGEGFQTHRLQVCTLNLIEFVAKTITEDYPRQIMPVVAQVALEQLQGSMVSDGANRGKDEKEGDGFEKNITPPKGSLLN